MNPNIRVEKAENEGTFTVSQIGDGAYIMPAVGVIVSYGGTDYVIKDVERIENKPPKWQVTADAYSDTITAQADAEYIQLITPNPEISCSPGICLVYVRETYRIGPKYPTATSGWDASIYKHQDKSFPENMWVPVWFSLADNPAGHVALRQPDGSIWSASDPTADKPVHHSSLEDMEQYFNGRLEYLGWTEDVEDEPVVRRT